MQVFLLGGGENISAWYSKLDACYKHAQRGGLEYAPQIILWNSLL